MSKFILFTFAVVCLAACSMTDFYTAQAPEYEESTGASFNMSEPATSGYFLQSDGDTYAGQAYVRSSTPVYDRLVSGRFGVTAYVSGTNGLRVFVGVTARKTNGQEFDLAAQEVQLSSGSTKEVKFGEFIGLGYSEYVISVWAKKISPCRSGRHGCKKYGYVLDGQLATTGWRSM